MSSSTDLTKSQIYKVFDMLDVDCSGTLDFDEFYLLVCILIAVQDKDEKHFIYRHSRTVFDLLDEDASGNISCDEFEKFGFLFNLQNKYTNISQLKYLSRNVLDRKETFFMERSLLTKHS
jgi:Ca2+-binding EF-hand superfamily protein